MRKLPLIHFLFVACLVALADSADTTMSTTETTTGPPNKDEIVENDILPPLDSKDCNYTETKLHQLQLFYKYRGLYDFRRYHNTKASDDFKMYSGSVIFMDYQDEVMHLKCPCGEKVSRWEQFGVGIESSEFNDIWNSSKARSNELNIKRPNPQNYYRTIGCFTKDDKEHHYFNIFTRPGPKTDFPVQFQEGAAKDMEKFFWRCYIRRNFKMNCLQKPYDYTWVFPKGIDTTPRPRKEGPPHGGIMIGKREVSNDTKGEIECYKKRSWDSCTKPQTTSYNVVNLTESPNQKKHAGVYECIVTDRNGLSSSFRYENLDGSTKAMKRIGDMRFGGFVHVHIRAFLFTFLPIIIIVVIFLLTILCCCLCPDNKEEYEEQLREAAEARRKEKQSSVTAAPAEAPSATASTTKSPDPPKPTVVLPDENESIMQQMTSMSSPAVKRKLSKKTTTTSTKGGKAEKGEEHEDSVHSSVHVAPHKKKKKHHPKP